MLNVVSVYVYEKLIFVDCADAFDFYALTLNKLLKKKNIRFFSVKR